MQVYEAHASVVVWIVFAIYAVLNVSYIVTGYDCVELVMQTWYSNGLDVFYSGYKRIHPAESKRMRSRYGAGTSNFGNESKSESRRVSMRACV